MTTSARPSSGKTLRLWLLGGGLLVALAAGVAVYLSRPPLHQPPAPPGESLDGLELPVQEVIQGARSLVVENPRSADAWGRLGEVFLANDLEQESRACFAEAERLDPANPRWPYYQGGALVNAGDYDDALPYLRRAVERCDSHEAAPRLFQGETLLTLGRSEEAETLFREVLSQHPDDPRVHYDLGVVAASRQDWATARDLLMGCLGSPHCRQKARIQLAQVCRRLGDLAAADEYHAQARRLPRDLDWADPLVEGYMQWAVRKQRRYRLVDQFEAAGRYADAVAVLRPMAQQYPDDYLPALMLGKMLGRAGDNAGAEAALRRARQLAPDKVQTQYYLSLVLFMRGDALLQQKGADRARAVALLEESAELAREAIRLQPDYGFAHMSLGLALRRLGRGPEGTASLRKAVLCSPEYAEIHFYLGEALAEDGQADEARSRLEQALRQAEPGAAWRASAVRRLNTLPGPKPKQGKPPAR